LRVGDVIDDGEERFFFLDHPHHDIFAKSDIRIMENHVAPHHQLAARR
jgi:hypothetical protein